MGFIHARISSVIMRTFGIFRVLMVGVGIAEGNVIGNFMIQPLSDAIKPNESELKKNKNTVFLLIIYYNFRPKIC